MKYSSQGKQLSIDTFRSSLEGLSKSNRWVQLGDTLPWDEIERLYNHRLNNGQRGAGNKPARMIIGSLLIKHKMNLSDEETILAIQENPYMQYFVGLSEFTDNPIFDPTLFVTIRKRLSSNDLNDMSVSLLKTQIEKARVATQEKTKDKDDSNIGSTPDADEESAQTDKELSARLSEISKEGTVEPVLLHDGTRRKSLVLLIRTSSKSNIAERRNAIR